MNKTIITTYHHSFAGGSKNTSRLIHYLSNYGYDVNAYFFEKPHYFDYTASNVKTHIIDLNNIQSEVIDSNVIQSYLFADKIITKLHEKIDPILFGANLFPYCNILHDVKCQLNHSHKNLPKLIIHPVGSDIWQIGPQFKSRVKWLLDNPLVDTIVTYSDKFVSEIKEYYNIKKDIYILPPVLEKEKFFPINNIENSLRRFNLGFNDEYFIIHHHSSMRKIKCPEIVLEIVLKAAQLISEKCVLIMVGPIPYDAINSLNLSLQSNQSNDLFEYKTETENLTIFWTGILSNVEYLMQISDVEINASLHDSFNLSLMEAMACGIPVVTSDIVGISNHILKADSGYCFPTRKLLFDELNKILNTEITKKHIFDIDYAINSIISLANNRVDARLKGQNGALYVVNEFSIENAFYEFNKYIN